MGSLARMAIGLLFKAALLRNRTRFADNYDCDGVNSIEGNPGEKTFTDNRRPFRAWKAERAGLLLILGNYLMTTLWRKVSASCAWLAVLLSVAVPAANAQAPTFGSTTQTFPQFATGGGWTSFITLHNSTQQLELVQV